jgi:hypothetical protein
MRKLDFTNTDFHRDKGKTHTVARLKKVALISPNVRSIKGQSTFAKRCRKCPKFNHYLEQNNPKQTLNFLHQIPRCHPHPKPAQKKTFPNSHVIRFLSDPIQSIRLNNIVQAEKRNRKRRSHKVVKAFEICAESAKMAKKTKPKMQTKSISVAWASEAPCLPGFPINDFFARRGAFSNNMKCFVEKATYKSLADGESCTYVFFSIR